MAAGEAPLMTDQLEQVQLSLAPNGNYLAGVHHTSQLQVGVLSAGGEN